MSFMDQLKKQNESLSSGNFDDDVVTPYSQLKNEPLVFKKGVDQLTVRILPPVEEGKWFAEGIKEVWLNTRNANGKDLNSRFSVRPENVGETKIANALATWKAENRVPSNHPEWAKLVDKFLVNAVQVQIGQDGSVQHETDQQGNLVIRLLTLPKSAYTGLCNKLGDEMLKPQGSGDASFISEENAFPIRFIRPPKSSGATPYSVEVYQRFDLGPLPQNWREQAEDLHYQSTPTEEYDPNFVDYFIAVVDGKEEEHNQNRSNNSNGTNVADNNQTQSNAPSFGGGFGQGGGQANPPQQQGFTQAPQQQGGFNNPPQQQSQPQPKAQGQQSSFNNAPNSGFGQQQQQSQPQQQQRFQGGFGQGTQDNGAQQFSQTPSAQPEQQSQPQQQQAQPTQQQPKQQATNDGPPNVDDLLNDDVLAELSSNLDS